MGKIRLGSETGWTEIQPVSAIEKSALQNFGILLRILFTQ